MSPWLKTVFRGLALSVVVLAAYGSRSTQVASATDEVTCAWCIQVSDLLGNTTHWFPNPGDLCGWPQPNGGPNGTVKCARCGGTSSCHSVPDDGECHLQCGGEGLTGLQEAVRKALEDSDALALAALISQPPEHLTIEFAKAGGRVNIVAGCDESKIAAAYPIPFGMRAELERAIRKA